MPITDAKIQELKKKYLPGTRLLLIHMDDQYNPVLDNTRGTVVLVDDAGDIHCKFDNGRSGLAIVPEVDTFRLLNEAELTEEINHTFKSGSEMYGTIMSSDLYCEEKELYVFLYNDAGAVCSYRITKEEANALRKKASEAGEYWGAFLGIGGEIYDDPMLFCNANYKGCWVCV